MAHARPSGRPPAGRRYGVLGVVIAVVLLVAVVFAAVGFADRSSDETDAAPVPGATGATTEGGKRRAPTASNDPVGMGRSSASPSQTPTSATPTSTPTSTPSSGAPTPRASTPGPVTPRPTPPDRGISTPAWTAGVAYRPGDRVTHQGVGYVCRQAHTAQADWQPQDTPTLWRAG